MASALAIIFLVLGIACQFLLTMESFTAGFQGIVCLLISIALCYYADRRLSDEDEGRIKNRIVAALAAVMILVHAVQIPANYEIQKKYRQAIDNARAISAHHQVEAELEAE